MPKHVAPLFTFLFPLILLCMWLDMPSHITYVCEHEPPVLLSSGPYPVLLYGFVVFVTFLCHLYFLRGLTTYVLTRSWGRCGWWSRAGRWHVPTCSASTPHFTSKWMRRSPPGCVPSATRRRRTSISSLMGRSLWPAGDLWSNSAKSGPLLNTVVVTNAYFSYCCLSISSKQPGRSPLIADINGLFLQRELDIGFFSLCFFPGNFL